MSDCVSSSTASAHLHQAYQQTCYQVRFAEQSFNLFPGLSNPGFDDYCRRRGIRNWAVITAFNPFSQALDDEQNQRLNQALYTELERLQLQAVSGDGIPADRRWQTEQGFFIWNISQPQALALARQFRQNAIVVGECRLPRRLKPGSLAEPDNLPQIIWAEPKNQSAVGAEAGDQNEPDGGEE